MIEADPGSARLKPAIHVVLVAEVHCYLCGTTAGSLEQERERCCSGARVTEGAGVIRPIQPIRCARCGGTTFIDDVECLNRWEFRRFSQAAGHQFVFEAGLEMGSLAASAVPPLLERLERPLTLELLRRRLLDFQVFGWAIVRRVALEDSLRGDLELDQTFESIAWQGKAPEPRCDFLRGFTTGVFSTAYSRPFKSTESRSQGKGDRLCSISFAPAT